MEPLIFIAVTVVLLWLLVIRPQRRRASQHRAMVGQVTIGAEIVTAGGLYGRVKAIDGDVLTVEIAPGTTVRIARGAIAGVIEPEGEQGAAAAPIGPDGS